jgi:two-component system cell cycle sensor histidine kinase/response regulator CckA
MERRMSQVLSEFARTLGTEFSIQAILDHLVVRIVDVLPIDGAGVTVMSADDQPHYVAASDDAAMVYERIQAAVGEGPCTVAFETGEPVLVPDLMVATPFAGFAERALASGLRAVFTFPLRHGEEQLGALDLYRTTPGSLTQREQEAAQTLADVAAAYLLNAKARVVLESSISFAEESAEHDADAVRALRASEARKSAILASVPDAVITIEAGAGIVEFNPAAERSFHCSADHARGRQLADFVTAPEELGTWSGLATQMAAQGDPAAWGPTELTAVCADGSAFPAEVIISAVRGDGPSLYTAFIRDLTRRKARAAEQQALEDRLHQTQRLESLGQLAGGVAHDFNNLLTVILNYAEFLVREVEGEELRDYGTQIIAAGQRAAQLTQQLLMFSRREPVVREPIDLNEVVADVHKLLSRTIGEHVQLEVRRPDGSSQILADRGQLEQVLMNLAVNARDAMDGAGTITVTTDVVVIGAATFVEMCVRDTGAGMSPATAAKAFDPFFTTKSAGEGSGLGLATVYGIVTEAGGTVELRSTEGVGTTVTVRFPVDRSDPSADPLAPEALPTTTASATVLVVEDQLAVRRVTVAILRSAGYAVLEAESAAEALRVSAADPVDMVLTDVVMPEVSGVELVTSMRASGLRPAVLFMSGYSGRAFGAEGADDHDGDPLLRKPFTNVELLEAVRSALLGAGVVGA